MVHRASLPSTWIADNRTLVGDRRLQRDIKPRKATKAKLLFLGASLNLPSWSPRLPQPLYQMHQLTSN